MTPLLHLLPLSELRAHRTAPVAEPGPEGFVHCSPDVATTVAVANTLYRDTDEQLVAVELDPDLLPSPVRWEAPSPAPPLGVGPATAFPHVYGPVPRTAITGVRYARRAVDGTFLDLERRGPTAEEFDLLPHPEGGWYRRTWTSGTPVDTAGGARPSATAIHFLLPPGEVSAWHVVASDEVWFWHRGSALTLSFGGAGRRPGSDPEQAVLGAGPGQRPQLVVPGGTWQRAESAAEGEALVSCVVSPGFDFADFAAL
ncbi:cupin domain-containing protein [Saccharopolyspora montiporae]|uniref:cupin domain-containing protein n=1 Tax=Saccharopolyspora montiporae TaxID=2781240 RepID=UPI00351C6529